MKASTAPSSNSSTAQRLNKAAASAICRIQRRIYRPAFIYSWIGPRGKTSPVRQIGIGDHGLVKLQVSRKTDRSCLTSGKTVRVSISGANDAGEGAPTAQVEAVVP